IMNAQLGETSRLAWLGVEVDPLAHSDELLKQAYNRPSENVNNTSPKWFISKNAVTSGLGLLGFKQDQSQSTTEGGAPPPPKARRKRIVKKKICLRLELLVSVSIVFGSSYEAIQTTVSEFSMIMSVNWLTLRLPETTDLLVAAKPIYVKTKSILIAPLRSKEHRHD
ncbi:hypothetical protein Tco_1413238, partial [Tanacetum coccineum]